MKRISLRHLLSAVCVLLIAAGQALALDLPVKRVKGKQYYYHKVKKGESLYGISHKIGISIEDIVRNNPSAADGVKKGDMLVFPFDEYSTETSAEPEQATAAMPGAVDTAIVDTAIVDDVRETNPTIALLLPFGADKSEPSRLNKLSVDFYKGVLIAADSLSSRPGKVDIVVRDTEGMTADGVRGLISGDSAVSRATVIIAPEDESMLHAIAEAAAKNRSYVLNTLNTRDSLYTENACLLQANVPQRRMYELAVDGLMHSYPGYVPVILQSDGGRNEREAFTAYLAERYRAAGTEPVTITYKSSLMLSQLDALPVGNGQKYVFVPSSASLPEFNKFAYVVMTFRDRLIAEANGSDSACAEIFGYPDWTAFRGDVLDTLHRLNATVYSRFFDDFNGFSARTIASDFRRWYGESYIESIPTYGLLGYDCACYIIKNIRNNDGRFDPLSPVSFSGVQSTFDFTRSGEGYVNNAIYIITYLPGGRVSAYVQ